MKKPLLATIFIALALVTSCIESSKTKQEVRVDKIGDIISNSSYIRKNVTVEGTITWACPSGCTINIVDDTGAIAIRFFDEGIISMQKKAGQKVIVWGQVSNDSYLIGNRIEFIRG